jgi:hypothetical protein
VTNHLAGLKAMITQRGGLCAWNRSSTARCLLSLFAYHDVLSSVSYGTRPRLDHSAEITSIENATDLESIAKNCKSLHALENATNSQGEVISSGV